MSSSSTPMVLRRGVRYILQRNWANGATSSLPVSKSKQSNRGVEESGNRWNPSENGKHLFAIHPPTGCKLGSRACLEFFLCLIGPTVSETDDGRALSCQKSISIFGLEEGGTQTKKYGNNLLQ